jgi:hypothetical protein
LVSFRIVLHFALKDDSGRHKQTIQASDFELYVYGAAGPLLGKTLWKQLPYLRNEIQKMSVSSFILTKTSIESKAEKELKSQGGHFIS